MTDATTAEGLTKEELDGLVERLEAARRSTPRIGSSWRRVSDADLALAIASARRAGEVEKERDEAIKLMSQYAREAGEATGRLKMSEAAGIVDGWRERAEAAEARAAAAEARTGMLDHAIYIAAGAHNGQIDKGGAPYIQHVMRVMRAVDGVEDKIVAVLHDLLEDCPDWTSERLLEEGFSADVVEAVIALTRKEDELYEVFIRRVATHPIARRVKIADLTDNMDLSRLRSPGPSDRERVRKYERALAILALQPKGDDHGG